MHSETMRRLILAVMGLASAASLSFADEKLPVLNVNSETYSNVTVFNISATDVYFTSSRGLANAKLKDLDPALQKRFNYNPSNAVAGAAKPAVADVQAATTNLKHVTARGPEQPPATRGKSGPGIDVYLVPLDDFDYADTVSIARYLSRELGITIQPTVKMGMAELKPYPGKNQFSGDDIIDLAEEAVTNFPSIRPDTVYIILTQRDINIDDSGLRFTFSVRNNSLRIAVVSSARLVMGEDGRLADRKIMTSRIVKMVKRNIGSMYFGYQYSTDIKDLMYSPVMSVSDVDRMGSDFIKARP